MNYGALGRWLRPASEGCWFREGVSPQLMNPWSKAITLHFCFNLHLISITEKSSLSKTKAPNFNNRLPPRSAITFLLHTQENLLPPLLLNQQTWKYGKTSTFQCETQTLFIISLRFFFSLSRRYIVVVVRRFSVVFPAEPPFFPRLLFAHRVVVGGVGGQRATTISIRK